MKNEQVEDSKENIGSINLEYKKLELFEKIINQIPGYLTYFDDKRSKHETPITKITIISFLIVIAVILIGTGLLVFAKLLDSSAFTFIVGTIMGYLFGISKIVLTKKDE